MNYVVSAGHIVSLFPQYKPLIKDFFLALGVAGYIAAEITAQTKPPTSGWRVPVWNFLNVLARNVKYAENAPPPE